MSIEDTFDYNGEEIISAKDNLKMIENFPSTLVVVFSAKLCNLFLSKYNAEKISALYAGGREFPIYRFEHRSMKMGFFHTALGGAASAALLEEIRI